MKNLSIALDIMLNSKDEFSAINNVERHTVLLSNENFSNIEISLDSYNKLSQAILYQKRYLTSVTI
jgi:hypothetical protein